jgi:hypothetical protein
VGETIIFLSLTNKEVDIMNQLFVFFTFLIILAATKVLPPDYGRNFSADREKYHCEKEIEKGLKWISVSDKKYLPCWLKN